MTPAACYLRVSTDRQDHANQRPDVLRLAETRGFDIGDRIYEETESTKKKRPVFAEMMNAARRGEFRALVFWSLDRFGRTFWETVSDIKELDRIGVTVLSCKEPWFDTTGPVRDLLLAIFAWVANHERDRLSERTKSGMQRARERGTKSGKPIGRPLILLPDRRQVSILAKRGLSLGEMAAELNCSVWAVRKSLRE